MIKINTWRNYSFNPFRVKTSFDFDDSSNRYSRGSLDYGYSALHQRSITNNEISRAYFDRKSRALQNSYENYLFRCRQRVSDGW